VSAHGQLTLSSAFLKLISAKPREEVVVTYNQEEDIIIIKKAYDTSVCCVCGETIVPKDAVTLKGSTLCHKCIDKLYKKKSKA
jgi:formylmethanofuran dehydrogenase subunit E